MSRRNNNSGIDWNLTRTVAAIQMGMPGAFHGMPVYDAEEDEDFDCVDDNEEDEKEEESNKEAW